MSRPTRPPDESHPDCIKDGQPGHLRVIAIKPGERPHCRRCGKTYRPRIKY